MIRVKCPCGHAFSWHANSGQSDSGCRLRFPKNKIQDIFGYCSCPRTFQELNAAQDAVKETPDAISIREEIPDDTDSIAVRTVTPTRRSVVRRHDPDD